VVFVNNNEYLVDGAGIVIDDYGQEAEADVINIVYFYRSWIINYYDINNIMTKWYVSISIEFGNEEIVSI